MSRTQLPDAVLVARHFDRDGRLIALPVKRERRLLVLAHLARHFPPATELDEYAVNTLLRPYSDDVASLRRALVDEGFLRRPEPGRYWREEPAGADLPHSS